MFVSKKDVAQDSLEHDFREAQTRIEETHRAFVTLLYRTFYESGCTTNEALAELGVDKVMFWRAVRVDRATGRKPEPITLMRWCHALYVYRGKRPADRETFSTIMRLAGYAPPNDINAARTRTTAQHAILQRSPVTDTLGDLTNKSYRKEIERATQNVRQFKKPGTFE